MGGALNNQSAVQLSLKKILEGAVIESSAPCRIDCGGTWDIRTFSLPFHHIRPTTVNLAVELRTRVRLLPFREGWTKVSSRDFLTEEYPSQESAFDRPLGLAFAIATFSMRQEYMSKSIPSPQRDPPWAARRPWELPLSRHLAKLNRSAAASPFPSNASSILHTR